MAGPVELKVVATTGERYARFLPYVASVSEAGRVAFQAERIDGTHAICVDVGDDVHEAVLGPSVAKITSHPDVDHVGALAFYGEDPAGVQAVFTTRDGVTRASGRGYHLIGPAGPTMNDEGIVAFRGERVAGVPGVHAIEAGGVRAIAERGDVFAEFFGLPLVDGRGSVVFRADTERGVQGIYRSTGDAIEPVVETGPSLVSIAPFPCWSADDGVAFVGSSSGDRDEVFVVRDGEVVGVPGGDAFETHRGCLVSGATLIRIATPRGGSLGLFAGSDPAEDKILAIGDALEGSTVDALAANPVSVDGRGDLAIVVGLADARQMVLRAGVT